MKWNILRERPGARLAHFGPLVFVHFRSHFSISDLEGDFAAQETLLAQWPALSQVVLFDASTLWHIGAPERSYAGQRLRAWGDRLLCSAPVLHGEGLAARMMRVAIMTAIAVSGNERQRMFSDVRPALLWVRNFSGQHPALAQSELDALARFDFAPDFTPQP